MRTLKISLLIFIIPITMFAQWEWMNPKPQANNLKKIFFTDSSIPNSSVLISTSGLVGSSYGESIPVKFLIRPALALAYNPFISLFSHISKGVFA